MPFSACCNLTPLVQRTASALPPPPPAGAAGGPDGRSNVALSGSAVRLRVRACARPRARLLPAQQPRATESPSISKAMDVAPEYLDTAAARSSVLQLERLLLCFAGGSSTGNFSNYQASSTSSFSVRLSSNGADAKLKPLVDSCPACADF